MAVKCGKAHGYHASAADVRRCYNGEQVDLVMIDKTPEGKMATGEQIRYAADLLRNAISMTNHQGLKTVRPIESYGIREISDLIALLKRNDRITPAMMHNFGLMYAAREPQLRQPVQQRQPQAEAMAREGYVKIPGLDNVWVEDTGRSVFDDLSMEPPSPRQAPRFDSQKLEDGFYVLNGVVYKVVVAVHGSGRKYARRLDEHGAWVRTSGLTQLRPEHKMTLQEALETAKRHGLNVQSELYGRCFVCGRTLTDDESIEAGIGPVCAGKFA